MPRTIFFKKIDNAAISPQTAWQPGFSDLSENDIDKYQFFNHYTVHNNSSIEVESRLFGANNTSLGVDLIPANGVLVYDAADGVKFKRPAIYNPDTTTTISASDIPIIIRKVI